MKDKKRKEKKKIGFSMETTSIGKLSELAAITGKSKSRIVEEAVEIFAKKQKIIDARIKRIKEEGTESLLNIDSIVQNRLNNEKIEDLYRIYAREAV